MKKPNELSDQELIEKCERIHEPTYFNYELYKQLLNRFRKLTAGKDEQVTDDYHRGYTDGFQARNRRPI